MSWWRPLLRREEQEASLENELSFHVEERVVDLRRSGLSEEEARRRVRQEFGGIEQVKEECRDARGTRWVENFGQDVRYAWRNLCRNLGFATVAIGTLALGIGATTAMFSVVRAVLLRPLPYAEPDRLFRVTETNPLKRWTTAPAAPANYADWRKLNHVFTDLAYYMRQYVFLTGFGEPQRLRAMNVSGNLFTVLGAQPMMGRAFREEESYEGKERVVILSYGLWTRMFAADPKIVGRSISLDNGKSYEVVGVMPAGFFFPSCETEIWMPAGLSPSRFIEHRRPHYLDVVGRLRPNVSKKQASEQMNVIAARLEQTYPETNTKMGVRLDRLHDTLFEDAKLPLLLLMGAVGLLFLIVCSNIANLQLGRASTRTHEFGIRQALGAGKARLTGQLLTESLMLSVLGGALGLSFAAGSHYLLAGFAAEAIPGFAEVRMDSWVLLFGAAVTLLAPMLFGLAPALTAAKTASLQDRSRIALRGNRELRSILVASEVALSVVLVVGSALLIQSLIRLQSIDPGFVPDGAISFILALPESRYMKPDNIVKAVQNIEENLRVQPGVEAAGASLVLPLKGWAWSSDATPEGRGAGDYERELRYNCATPEYFRAAGIKVRRGRVFNQFDQPKSEPVAVVNEALERAYFRGQSAVGKRIKFGRPTDKDPWVTIVGVVADAKQDSMSSLVQPLAYKPFTQQPNDVTAIVVRGAGVTPDTVRRAVAAVDPNLPINDLAPLQQLVTGSLGSQRFRASLLGGFAAVALFLASLGIYGVLAYSVAQRAKEIGVRLALGAPHLALFRMVVSEGMRPVIAGGTIGVVGAVAAARLLQALLFGVTPTDLSTYVATCTILVTVAFAACAIPARRAVRTDPLVALREA